MNWIGRDVTYIIHDGNGQNNSRNNTFNADIASEVDGDDFAYRSGNDNINGAFERGGGSNFNKKLSKRNQVRRKSNAKSFSTLSSPSSTSYRNQQHHQELFVPELPKIIHHQWKTDTVPG